MISLRALKPGDIIKYTSATAGGLWLCEFIAATYPGVKVYWLRVPSLYANLQTTFDTYDKSFLNFCTKISP